MKGVYTSLKNLCPICSNHHGCKIHSNNGVFCLRGMGHSDAPPGYRFLQPLRNGMGGLFVLANEHDNSNSEQRACWRQEQDFKRLLRSKELASRQAKLLSIEERDAQYRLVNRELTLIARHRQVLLERGLTDTEIEFAFKLGAIARLESSPEDNWSFA